MNHTEILNLLAEKINAKSYLEIGVRNPANNLYKIRDSNPGIEVCGVDPDVSLKGLFGINTTASDDLFYNLNNPTTEIIEGQPYTSKWLAKWDLIFIDGLHHADQVKRDFENSLKCLNDGGFIVIHDTLPDKEEYTKVPRETKIWYGDVYKFAMKLSEYANINFLTVDTDCGCTVVWKGICENNFGEDKEYSWQEYLDRRNIRLNIISVDQFKEWLNVTDEVRV